MSISEALMVPVVRRDNLDRLDIREEGEGWRDIDRSVQVELIALDAPIRDALPSVRVRAGSNSGRSCYLFSYRVYEPLPQTGIDPVVVGLSFVPVDDGRMISIRGDISGETLGDILFEAPRREVADARAASNTVQVTCRQLARGVEAVIAALQDPSRNT